MVNNTLALLDKYIDKFALVLSTPIHFTQDYSELKNPIGILKVIAEVGAFKADSYGAQGIKEFDKYGKRIMQIPGKRGLNAFTHTELANVLNKNGINNIVLAGTVTSICIDSTARAAVELGFNVTVLNDCTSSRTPFEQSFYCEEVFPLYATVCSHTELVNE